MAINLGDINFGLGPDTTRLERARRQVIQFGSAVDQAAQSNERGARQQEAAMRRQEKAILSTLQQLLKLNEAVRKAGDNPAQLNRTTQIFNRLTREMANGRVSALQFQRSMEDVQAGVGRVNRALGQHTAEQQRVARAEREAAKATQEQTMYILKQERALFQASQAVDRFQAALARTKNAPSNLGASASSGLNQFKGALAGGMMDPIAFQRASQTFQAGMSRNTEALRKFQAAQRGASDNKLAQSLDRLANISVLLNGPLGGIAARLSVISSVADKVSLSTAGMVVGVAGAAYAFMKLGQGAVDASKVFQRVEQSLDSLNELTSLTATEMEYLMDVADRSGGSFGTMSQQFAKIQAAAEGTNLEGIRTVEIFELISLAGAKMSLSQDEIAGSLRAVEQIMSKGTLQAEELRGQLGDRIPGAVGIMARALGVTTKELGDLMKQGKITSDSLLPFAQELARTYGVELGDAIDTVVSGEGRLFNALLRANKAADEAIGFSKAYQNSLSILTGWLDTAANNMDLLVKITVSAGAAFAVLYAPALLTGLMTLITMIRTATASMLALNAATLSNPLGAIASVLTKVALAAAAAAGAFALLDSWMESGNAATMADDLRSNGDALTMAAHASAGFRSELEMQIRMQKMAAQAAWDEALAQYGAAKAKGAALQADADANKYNPLAGFALGSMWQMGDNKRELAAMDEEMNAMSEYMTSLDTQLAYIEEMRKKLGEGNTDINATGDGSGAKGAKGAATAFRDAQQAIADLDAQWAVFQMPEGMREWANTQADMTKKVADFKDKLTDAKVPAAAITALTDQYAASLYRLEEASYAAQHSVDIWKAFGDVMGAGLDSVMDSFLDSVIDGKDALLELRDVGKAVATDLLKTFTQLAVMNPIKNFLFGQQNQTMSMGGSGGGGGLGGLLSGLFGGLFGGGKAATGGSYGNGLWGSAIFSAKGNAFGSGGGLLTAPTMFNAGGRQAIGGELGDEAILPLGRTSSGDLGVMSSGGGGSDSGAQNGDFIANFYISANGDEQIMSTVQEAMSQAFAAYDATSTQRTVQSNIKAKFRRMQGARG